MDGGLGRLGGDNGRVIEVPAGPAYLSKQVEFHFSRSEMLAFTTGFTLAAWPSATAFGGGGRQISTFTLVGAQA